MITKEQIQSVIDPFLEENGLFIVQLDVSLSNKISLIVDSMKGVGLQECVNLNRLIESGFDRESEDFELEVSSAGLGVPFRVLKQYQKNIGNELEVVLKTGNKLTGKLLEVNNLGIIIEIQKIVKTEDKKKKQLLVENKNFTFEEISKIYNSLKFIGR
jgi:ribosome maturation factor RimP